ncbi:MAG: hypothetical protein ACR2PL_05565 [Dehalococcoidia bacterium]
MLTYLLFPRPGPFFSLGKVSFFLLGSFVVLASGSLPYQGSRWLLVFALYELVISQGKYLLNDLVGRGTDHEFLRGARNRFPRTGPSAWIVGFYAVARLAAGVAGLLLVAGPAAALTGVLTILLQLVYELTKCTAFVWRGWLLFVTVSVNYGVRALAGMVAIAGTAAVEPRGLLTVLWAAGLGALFLSVYWQRQAAYYLERERLPVETLVRHKPGMLVVYQAGQRRAARAGRQLPEQVLLLLLAGAAPFALLGSGALLSLHAVAFVSYLGCYAALSVARQHVALTEGRGGCLRAMGAAMVVGGVADCLTLVLHSTLLLPFGLSAMALLTDLILTGGMAQSLLMDGAPDATAQPV